MVFLHKTPSHLTTQKQHYKSSVWWCWSPLTSSCRKRGPRCAPPHCSQAVPFPGGQLCSHSLGMESQKRPKDMAWSLCCFGAMETETHLPNTLWKCLNTSNTLDHVCALLICELLILAVYFLAPGGLWVWCPSFQIHVWSLLSAQLASSTGCFFFPADLCTWMLFSK